MSRLTLTLLCVVFFAGCARLPTLTPDILAQAEQKWATHKPDAYSLVIEMSGDRVERGRFDVQTRSGSVVSLRRNGLMIPANPGQDYSMDGLFHMLEQELGLAEKPSMLGAPEGYAVYVTAKFDDTTGRLLHYRRIVGGTANSIDINVVGYQEGGK